METATIILLSVLSTLGAVAIITLVVVAFYKLSRKVDIISDELHNSINQQRTEIDSELTLRSDEINSQLQELKRELDSRCDKLDNKIKTSTTQKQVLQG